MEGADSGSLLIRAPVSLPEECELAPGASTFSEDEDFFLSGEEDGGGDDFEDVSKPVLLQKVLSMPKAPVSGEDDDVAELFDDDEDDASALPKAATVVIEENGHSNGDGEVLEKEEKETSNEEISVEDSMGDVSGEGSKPREEHAVAVKDDETSNREENLRVDLQVDEIDQEEKLREDPVNSASRTDFPGDFPSDVVDMESKPQVDLVTPAPATDLPGDSPSDEIDKESKLQVGLATPAPATELLEDSQVDQTSKEIKLQVGLVSPAPATELPEDSQVDQISKESKLQVGLDTSAPATEFSKDSQADEASKESELQVGVVTPAPATEFHGDHQIDEKSKENKLQEGVVTSAPHTEFPEDSQADETSIESKFLEDLVSPSPSTEFHEDSQSDDTGKESKLEEELVTTPPLAKFYGDSLANETKKESESQEDLLTSSPSTKLNEESHADEVNKLEEEPVTPAPLAEFHEDSQANGTNKENSSPPAEFHEDSQVEKTGKDIKFQEEPITPAPPTEIHEDSQADENSRERSLPENSVTVSPSTEFQVLQEPTGRASSISEVETNSEETLASGSTAGDPLECLPQKDETNHEQALTDGYTGDKTGKERAINENLELSSEDELADLINGLLDGAGNFDAVVGQDDSKPSVSQTEEEKPIASETFVEQPAHVDESKVSLSEGETHAQKPSEVEENHERAEEKKDFVSSEKEEKVMGSGDNEIESETSVFRSKDKEVEIKLDEDLKLDIQEVLMPPIGDSDEDLDPIQDDSRASDDEDMKIEESTKFKEQLDNVSLATNRVSASTDGYSDGVDGQIVSYSDEEDSDEDDDGKELFDSAALTALLKAASGASSTGEITFTAPDGSRIFSVDRPAGLGSSIPSLKPAAPRPNRSNIFSPTDLSLTPEADSLMDEEEKKLQEKVDQIKVKFLRLVHRLGHSPEDRVVAQVLYRLSLAEGIRRGRQIGRAFSLENAKKKALQLEEEGKEPLDFSCNILLLGKTGVGKSALINSIFGEQKVKTSAFDMSTHSVKEIVGVVDGVNVRIIDTPGLRPSVMDQAANMKILNSINKHTKRFPPDIVLYVDRLDTQAWDFNDLPLLRSIATSMGPAIWFNAIVALTHGASAPPDGSSGSPLSYEVFVDQRSRVVQHAIRQAAGDMRLMNPVSLVENHPSCRRNREGQRVLPNGLAWRSQLLLLCYSSKILSEANSILKLQDSSPSKLFGFRTRSPPLPFLLSSLLQSKSHPKLTADQGVDQGDSDFDLDDLDEEVKEGGEEEEDEYDRLPPFKPLRKSQLAKLTKDQRRAYFDEYEYRVKLLQKKQWKEELMRARERKKRAKQGQELPNPDNIAGDYDDDGGAPATIPVPLPDMVLPPSFDCDNPAFRYRFLEPSSQLLTRPVLDSHGWDHDCGYDGVSLEDSLSIAGKYPASVSAQITKDKKDFTIHLDSSIAAIHGENGSTLAGFDVQSVGKQLAYILRSETKFKTLKKNKTAAGVSVTFLGENVAAGMKVEDELVVGKRLGIAVSAGTMRSKGDAAYGANVEIRLRDKEFPIGQDLSTLGLSLMRWRGDLALGANLQSQFSVGRGSKVAVRFGLNNKRSGQITVRLNSSEQLQIALMGIIPVAASIYRSFFAEE